MTAGRARPACERTNVVLTGGRNPFPDPAGRGTLGRMDTNGPSIGCVSHGGDDPLAPPDYQYPSGPPMTWTREAGAAST
jgi:hypothetical protein